MKTSLTSLFDDELFTVRLGRFSDAEERLIKRVMTYDPVGRWLSSGRDLRKPGYYSTRPLSPEGRETFSFSHRNVVLRGMKSPMPDRAYCVGAGAGTSAGLKFDRNVRLGGGRGCWYAPDGQIPAGFVSVSPVALSVGQRAGSAALHQAYIERFGAVELCAGQQLSLGTIHDNPGIRQQFWYDVEKMEGETGRVQSRLIADLPFEAEVGAEGRRDILEGLGEIFSDLGLPWHGVVHMPEPHSDPRNYHLHLLYHARPVKYWTENDEPVFATAKERQIHSPEWIKSLRAKYAELVNSVFERAGLARRWDPRSYEAQGIAKIPGKHLGSAAMGLERRGIVTTRGVAAARAEIASELHALRDTRKRAARKLRARLTGVRESLNPAENEGGRLLLAKEEMARAIARHSKIWWEREEVREQRALTALRRKHWLVRVDATSTVEELKASADRVRGVFQRVLARIEVAVGKQEKRLTFLLTQTEREFEKARENVDYERRRQAYIQARSALQLGLFGQGRDGKISEQEYAARIRKLEEELQAGRERTRREKARLLEELTEAGIDDGQSLIEKFTRYGYQAVPDEVQELFLTYETCLKNSGAKEGDLRLAKRAPVRAREDQLAIDQVINRRRDALVRAGQRLLPDQARFQRETGISLQHELQSHRLGRSQR